MNRAGMRGPQTKAPLWRAALKAAEVLLRYYILFLPVGRGGAGKNGEVSKGACLMSTLDNNPDIFHQQDARHCFSCGVLVNNWNLGGHSRKSALAGDLWCYRCADCPRQLLVRLD
jgi:hypothetical protein